MELEDHSVSLSLLSSSISACAGAQGVFRRSAEIPTALWRGWAFMSRPHGEPWLWLAYAQVSDSSSVLNTWTPQSLMRIYRNLMLSLVWGQGAMAPIVSVRFPIIIILLPLWSSMAAYRTACGKVMKFGTLIEDSPEMNHSKFWVSNSNSLAPPLVQSFTHVLIFKEYHTIRICFQPCFNLIFYLFEKIYILP